jgi:hypothetical protein
LSHGGLLGGRGWGCKFKTLPKSPKPKFKKKNKTYVDKTMSKVLYDLPVRRNQPQNSAADRYIRTLKNEIIK